MNNIVFITDENYIIPTKTAINSIIQNATSKIIINVIGINISEENKMSILALQSKKIIIRVFPFENQFAYLGLNHQYVSKAALFKFHLPEIFAKLDSILYADGDMIFFPGFEKIFEYDISNYYAAVVEDMLATAIENWAKRINHEKYFNSGIMYINLKKWREDSISEKLKECKRNDTDDHFMDQNVLNKIIGNNVLWINPKFNLMASCSIKTFDDYYKDGKALDHIASFYDVLPDEMNKTIQHPTILHLTGLKKAWKDVNAERIDEWLQYVLPEDYLSIARNYCLELSKIILSLKAENNEQNKKIDLLYKKEKIFYYNLGDVVSFCSKGNAFFYMISGFSESESWGCWTNSKEVKMKFSIENEYSNYIIKMDYNVFDKQHVLFYINEKLVSEYDAISGEKIFTISRDIIKDNELLLCFKIPTAKAPKSLGISNDDRILGLGFKSIKIYPNHEKKDLFL